MCKNQFSTPHLTACININNSPIALVKVCRFQSIKKYQKLKAYYSQIFMTRKHPLVISVKERIILKLYRRFSTYELRPKCESLITFIRLINYKHNIFLLLLPKYLYNIPTCLYFCLYIYTYIKQFYISELIMCKYILIKLKEIVYFKIKGTQILCSVIYR